MLIATDEGAAQLGKTGSGWGLRLADGSGAPMAELSEPQGKGMALRIYSQGANAAQIGVAPGTGGLLRLFASGDQRTIGMDSNADGTGMIQVAGKKGEDAGIKLDGQKEVIKLDAEKGAALLGTTTKGWGLAVMDAGGEVLADLARPDGKGPALRIYESGQQAAAVGLEPGQGGQLWLAGHGVPAVWSGASDGGGRVQAYKAGVATAVLNGPGSTVGVVNASGVGISMLTIAASGAGGKIVATDPGGTEVFKAGYIPDGPGAACLNDKGASKCLGVGLTGMEGFH